MVTWKLTVATSTIDQRNSPRNTALNSRRGFQRGYGFSKAAAGLRPAPSNALCPDAPRIKQISELVVDDRPTVAATRLGPCSFGKVPELARNVGIQLNEQVSLRRTHPRAHRAPCMSHAAKLNP